ncbi:MAG: hypothetical protein NC548_12945 [Lachnospiraceae bacterium]|nr:hypothetical protein [Lachnospiraceae bacterium]MCM1230702.1 hypothetical protein [Ruminococcus flavefaciens]
MAKSKSDILKGLEFVEPITNDARTEIEITHKVNLKKGHLKPMVKEGSGFSKLLALTVSNKINRFLIETGKFTSVKVSMYDCELKHCMDIPSSRWGDAHWLVLVSTEDKDIYIDPLASRLEDLDPDMPDIYIGEELPPYASSVENPAWYWKYPWSYSLEFKVRAKICDWLATKVFKLR